MKQLKKRNNNNWPLQVLGRLECVNDLFAEDAIYHVVCSSGFTQDLPHTPRKVPRGRPQNVVAEGAFTQLCDWLECKGDNELYTLNNLYEQMVMLASVDVSLLYSKKYLRQLLKECYTDCIYFASQPGSDDVTGFRNYSKLIVHNKWLDDHNTSGASEAERVV